MKKIHDHPEVADLINICKYLPKTEMTQGVCDIVNNERKSISLTKKYRKKK